MTEVDDLAGTTDGRPPRRGVESAVSPLLPPNSSTEPVLSVVMPTLNEERSIASCIRRTKRSFDELDVPGEIIVSDSSTDRTPEIARSLGATVVSPDREGYGSAYQRGLACARGEYIVMGDADCTYDFAEIPRLYDTIRQTGADMILGSRLLGEIKPGAMPPLHRYVGNPVLTELLNLVCGTNISDAHSGYRIIRRDALEKLDLETAGMEFASEMIFQACQEDLTVREIPITYYRRRGEPELDSLRDGWRHVEFLVENASWSEVLSRLAPDL